MDNATYTAKLEDLLRQIADACKTSASYDKLDHRVSELVRQWNRLREERLRSTFTKSHPEAVKA